MINIVAQKIWSEKRGSNPRPSPWKGDALPAELFSHKVREQGILILANEVSDEQDFLILANEVSDELR